MTVFVDTSGVLAMLDASDAGHAPAAAAWKKLLESGASLVTTSYVLVELIALAQHRLGIAAVRDIDRTLVPRCAWSGSTPPFTRAAWRRCSPPAAESSASSTA